MLCCIFVHFEGISWIEKNCFFDLIDNEAVCSVKMALQNLFCVKTKYNLSTSGEYADDYFDDSEILCGVNGYIRQPIKKEADVAAVIADDEYLDDVYFRRRWNFIIGKCYIRSDATQARRNLWKSGRT